MLLVLITVLLINNQLFPVQQNMIYSHPNMLFEYIGRAKIAFRRLKKLFNYFKTTFGFMKSSAGVLIHLGYWLVYLAIWGVVMAAISQSPDFNGEDAVFYLGLIVGIAIVPALYSFYIFYYLLFDRYLQKREILMAFMSGLLISLSSFLVAALTLKITAGMDFNCYGESNYIAILIVSFISFLNGGIAFIIRGFITWFDEIKVKEELVKKNHEMELALVKSQLDPHFLFNTLNNIDVLMLKDAERASTYLNKLSDIMRFILFETKSTVIPLIKEIEYISKYVELQKIRASNPDYVSYEVIGDPSGTTIAPLVFIPIIENAFKHTTNKKLQDAIKIKININGKSVHMQCNNKFDPNRNSEVKRNGLGHDLISKRLRLLYPDQHQLKVNNQDNVYTVSLNIEYEQA